MRLDYTERETNRQTSWQAGKKASKQTRPRKGNTEEDDRLMDGYRHDHAANATSKDLELHTWPGRNCLPLATQNRADESLSCLRDQSSGPLTSDASNERRSSAHRAPLPGFETRMLLGPAAPTSGSEHMGSAIAVDVFEQLEDHRPPVRVRRDLWEELLGQTSGATCREAMSVCHLDK